MAHPKTPRMHEDGDGLSWAKRRGHWEQVCAWTRSGHCTHIHSWAGPSLFTSGPPAPDDGDHWGPWHFDADTQVLAYRSPSHSHYEIELERARGYLDQAKWLRHVSEKSWLRHGDLDDLAQAMFACESVPLKRRQAAM